MTIKKVVQAKMVKVERPDKPTVRYSGIGVGNECWGIYVRNEAYEKLGKPRVIRVTIEAVPLDDNQ